MFSDKLNEYLKRSKRAIAISARAFITIDTMLEIVKVLIGWLNEDTSDFFLPFIKKNKNPNAEMSSITGNPGKVPLIKSSATEVNAERKRRIDIINVTGLLKNFLITSQLRL